MPRKLTEKQLKEAEFWKEWIFTIVDFMIAKSLVPESARAYSMMKENVKKYYRIAVETGDKIYYTGLKVGFGDMNEWARALSRADAEELNAILREKFGTDLVCQFSRDAKEIERIKKRGKIRDSHEFRFVTAWIDLIQDDPSKAEDVEILDRMLSECDVRDE